mmetsp:Transcript_20730/g.48086  ORF Transcript_20730/g.48086 Transcript_20730/m.48086 type:complete len:434 (+) Transcript_20730:153-1454(+)
MAEPADSFRRPDSDAGWEKIQLMGGIDTNGNKDAKGKGVDNDPTLWGRPGHLTSTEADTFYKFKEEVESRGGDFKDTVYCFGPEEGEVWALCRWLRARKYVYEDVVAMIEEATEVRKSAKEHDFYPNPVDALGCEASLFYAQYPQLYSGYAKTGVPLFISKPGVLNVDGMEVITTLDGILKFHWYIMMHDFANRLRSQKAKDPDNFKRFECLCVLDLANLTMSQLGRKTLSIIKEQSAIDSVAFPETMYKMILLNAPSFFSATWKLIKGWLDPRTAAKIEVISSTSAGEQRLLELVDADQLPSDYGGKAEDTERILANSCEGEEDRLVTKVLYLRGSGSESVEVPSGMSVQTTIITRSTSGALFTLTDSDTKEVLSQKEIEVIHKDEKLPLPTRVLLKEEKIKGPVKLKVKAISNASRFTTHNFLIAFSLFKE